MTTNKAAQSPKTNTLTQEQEQLRAAVETAANPWGMTHDQLRDIHDVSNGINTQAVAIHNVEGSSALPEETIRRMVYAGYGEDPGGFEVAIQDEVDYLACLDQPEEAAKREEVQRRILELRVAQQVAIIDDYLKEVCRAKNRAVDRLLGLDRV